MYKVFSLSFETSINFFEVENAGLDAKIFVYKENETEYLTLTFVFFSLETQKNLPFNDFELLNYVKTTFLGTSKPAFSQKERTIFNKKSQGEVLSTKIPVPSDLEIHLFSFENGEKICIAFKSLQEMPQTKRESIILEVLNNLKNC